MAESDHGHHRMFSRIAGWIMSVWKMNMNVDFQAQLQRKIQEKQYGIQFPVLSTPGISIEDEMELLLNSIKNQIPECRKGHNPSHLVNSYDCDMGDNYSITIHTNTSSITSNLSDRESLTAYQNDVVLNINLSANEDEKAQPKPQKEILKMESSASGGKNINEEGCKSDVNEDEEDGKKEIDERGKTHTEEKSNVNENEEENENNDISDFHSMTEILKIDNETNVETENIEISDFHSMIEMVNKDIENGKNSNDYDDYSEIKESACDNNLTEKNSDEKVIIDPKCDETDSKEHLDVEVVENVEETGSSSSFYDISSSDNEKPTAASCWTGQKAKSVTWDQSVHLKDLESTDSGSSLTQSSSDDFTIDDLAYGNEGLAQYNMYIKLEQNMEIHEIKQDREYWRQIYKWRIDKIHDIVEVAKAYYMNPTGKAVEGWKELKHGLELDKKNTSNTDVKFKLAKLPEFMPFFTIFITLVQFLATGILCYLGGIMTPGIEPSIQHAEHIQTFVGLETVHKWIIPNLWIGPSDKYLISVGAFFAPCIRNDFRLKLRTMELNYSTIEPLGCCEMASRNTAATTTKAECDDLTGGVGVWKANIKCSERQAGENSISHNLKPCCYNVQGHCKLMTHQHCVFLDGSFSKQSAEHCSQVNCFGSICGIGDIGHQTDKPWLPESPNQWWRLPLSLIYHNGIVHVVITVILHTLIMRIMERSMGWLRIMIVYLMSGLGGLLAAALFEPYSSHVGATGSLLGLLGVTIVEILLLWKYINKPWVEILKILSVIIVYLVAGTVQYISNYTVITGFAIGLCMGVIVLPYVTFSKMSQRSRVILIALCIPLLIGIYFVLLFLFLKGYSFTDCYVCKVINCVPYTDNMCRDNYED